ncbi:hypothetical protein A2Z56_02630 [Candidatus Kaiserbacteria bacterium RIFCSPHIGHO2_12_45_16]|nr:MAG: hypothetical protein A2Z56_02630 [Candidatus Kaiserbacteria bacterium RIFCSPHIGHO2_12_45_16]
MKYQVVGEGETVEILGVLRTPGDILKLLPNDAAPHVADGSLVEMPEEPVAAETEKVEEVPVVPDGGDSAANAAEVTPENAGAVAAETTETKSEEAQPTGVAAEVVTPEPETPVASPTEASVPGAQAAGQQ